MEYYLNYAVYMKIYHFWKVLQKKNSPDFDPLGGSRPLATGPPNHAAERCVHNFTPINLKISQHM